MHIFRACGISLHNFIILVGKLLKLHTQVLYSGSNEAWKRGKKQKKMKKKKKKTTKKKKQKKTKKQEGHDGPVTLT